MPGETKVACAHAAQEAGTAGPREVVTQPIRAGLPLEALRLAQESTLHPAVLGKHCAMVSS